jgi:hypothetical protein
MRKMHDSDSYISETECPKRTVKSCIALKRFASVANNNMEHAFKGLAQWSIV